MNAQPKILIVDDKPENLVALEVILRDVDVELVKATSGNEALKQTLYHDFALALLDIQMPDMDGYELAEILRTEEKTARLPFIFVSAIYTEHINIFKGYEQGAFSYITKPFQPEILVSKVKFFIEKHLQDVRLHRMNEDLEEKNILLGRLNQSLQDNNAALESMNRELESFTYSISHDLRAPLRAINGYAKILGESYEDKLDADGEHLLHRISANAIQMGHMIDSLLNLSRFGRRKVVKRMVDLNALVREVIAEVQSDYMPERHRIDVGNLHPVSADRELLRQVLFNLLSNAFKYSSKRTEPVVEISSYATGDAVVCCIRDNGAGFDMRYAERLYGVFQRLHGATEFEGTGIGLAIVRRILTHHGGKSWAEGEVDKGAAFYFSLPVERPLRDGVYE